jgi:HlyD family secretion protein
MTWRLHPRIWLMGAAGLIVLMAIAAMLWPKPVAVEVGTVVRGPIAESVADQGQARVREAYQVAAPVAGRLERTALKVGDHVSAGQRIAQIRPGAAPLLDPAARAQREGALAAARADLARAEAEKARTAVFATRNLELAKSGFVSRQQIDDASASAKEAANAAEAARSNLAQAQAALLPPLSPTAGLVFMTAPVSGYVTKVLEPSARTVTAGTPLLEISDGTGLEAVIEFLTQDAARIREGMNAEVYDWGGPQTLPAFVRRVEPSGYTKVSALGVEEQRTYVWLHFNGPAEARAGLAPGYRVWGRVILRAEPHALKVPLGALVRRAGAWMVYRIEAGRARARPVQVGALTDTEAEVKSGLAEGDKVVVFPPDTVAEGVLVKPR